jgi:hypothetical protein
VSVVVWSCAGVCLRCAFACSYGVAVFVEPRSGAGWSVGIPQPYLSTPWANHRTLELLLEVWHKREGWCGPPMVGRPVITITPARAFCTGLEVGGFRFVELYLTT